MLKHFKEHGAIYLIITLTLLLVVKVMSNNKDIDASLEGKVTDFIVNKDNGGDFYTIKVEVTLNNDRITNGDFICFNRPMCEDIWNKAIEDGRINGFKTISNSFHKNEWIKGVTIIKPLSVSGGLFVTDSIWLLLLNKFLIGLVLLLVAFIFLNYLYKDSNHD